MQVNLNIYHHHHMSDKRHHLSVKINTLDSILDLKQAILNQHPSKINFFIAHPKFQTVIFHGKIFDDKQSVNDLISCNQITSLTVTNNNFPTDIREGRIILVQYPRNDKHLKQIHNIITDPSPTIQPFVLSKKYQISIPRIMKIIHYLEASGFVQIDPSPPTRNHSENNLSAIEEQTSNENSLPFIEHDNHQNHNSLSVPQLSHSASNVSLGSVGSNLSLSLTSADRELLRHSLSRVMLAELAEMLLFTDNEIDQQEAELADEQKENDHSQ